MRVRFFLQLRAARFSKICDVRHVSRYL
jgi:hypothetical protein